MADTRDPATVITRAMLYEYHRDDQCQPRHAAASALAEALRGMVCVRCNRMIGSPCAPDIMECPVCAEARTALARWEKGES